MTYRDESWMVPMVGYILGWRFWGRWANFAFIDAERFVADEIRKARF